jgi:hypothetical protein
LIKDNTDAIPLYTNYAAGWTMGGQWDAYLGAITTGDTTWLNQKFVKTAEPFKDNGDGTGAYALYKILYDAVAMGLTEEDYSTTDWEGCKGMINRGEIGTMVLGSWAVAQMKAAGENPDDIGYMPFPMTIAGQQYATAGPDYSYGINAKASAENQTAAMVFVKWMVEESGWCDFEGRYPISKTAPTSFAFDGVEVVKVFNNEIIQEIIYIYYDKNVNHVCENITTIFNSNFNSKSIIKKELISHDSTSNSNGFEVIQSYLLTNQLINMNIFNEWLIKNNTYSVGLNKACYGTFLTALTTLHYNDMITAYYAYYFNITYSRQEDIQILVGVNINELTTVTTNDPTTGNTIYTGTTKNKFYFRLLTTLMFSECERIAVQISNQEVTSSILEFLNDAKQLKTMTFTFYNDTNIMNITTTNSKYYIELDMTTGIAKAYLNSELQYNNIHLNEFLKGAEGTEGEGGCYHDEKTDNIVHSTGKVYEVTVKKNKTVSEDEIWDKIFSEVGSFVEDSAGSMAVTAGVMLIFASGGTAIPVIGAALFVTGATACFHAAGANSLDDLTNPQIFCEGALSVTLAAVGGGELTAAKNIMKISKATTNSQLFKTTVTATIDQSGYNSAYGIADNYCKSKVQSLEIEHMHNLLTNKTGE